MNKKRIGEPLSNTYTSFCFDDSSNRFICITNDGLLMEIDLSSFNSSYIELIHGKELLNDFLSYKSTFYNGKAFFFSYTGTDYLVYDTRISTISKRSFLGEEATPWDERPNVLDVVMIKDNIYVFLRNNNIVYKIDAMSGEIINSVKYGSKQGSRWAVHYKEIEYILIDEKIYIYDFETGAIELIKDILVSQPIQDVFADAKGLAVLLRNGDVITVGRDFEQIEYKTGCLEDELSILIRALDTIWLFPKYGDEIYKVKNGMIEKYNEYDDRFFYLASEEWYKKGYKYLNYVVVNSIVFFPLRVGNMICTLDINDGIIKWYLVNLPSGYESIKVLMRDGTIVRETYGRELRDFVEAVSREDKI